MLLHLHIVFTFKCCICFSKKIVIFEASSGFVLCMNFIVNINKKLSFEIRLSSILILATDFWIFETHFIFIKRCLITKQFPENNGFVIKQKKYARVFFYTQSDILSKSDKVLTFRFLVILHIFINVICKNLSPKQSFPALVLAL